MFSVLFEVQPRPERQEDYLAFARLLRPELEKIDGFVDNVRLRSLTRAGWLLSLSGWRDEKSLVRWRTNALHHGVQQKGRDEVFLDYHLRVGEVTHDSHPPPGHVLREQRLDETEVGAATVVTLIDARRGSGVDADRPADLAAGIGLPSDAPGLVAWDVFEALLDPGAFVLAMSWRDRASAAAFERSRQAPPDRRLRHVRIVRDYGLLDRREAPQYYAPPAPPEGGAVAPQA